MKEKITIAVIMSLSAGLGFLAHNWYIAVGASLTCMVIMFVSHLHTVRIENRYRTQKYNTYVIHMNPDSDANPMLVNARPHAYIGTAIPRIPDHLVDQCVFVTQGNMNTTYNNELHMLKHVGNKCLVDPDLSELEKLKVVCVPFRDAKHANEKYFGEDDERDYARRVVEVIEADHQGRRLILEKIDPTWDMVYAMGEKEKQKPLEEL